MKVTTISANVRYSKDTGHGAWKVVELGAEANLSPSEDWMEAQQQLYYELGVQLKALWGNGTPAKAEETAEQEVPREHWCQEHGVAFKERVNRQTGTMFYSHKIDGEKGWCNEL